MLRWECALRFLWNIAHEQRLSGYARLTGERKFPSAFDQINELTELRKELDWLSDVPRNVCAQLLVELDKAWQYCFSRLKNAPKWKRKGRDQISLIESHCKVWRFGDSVIRFPKLGDLRAVIHRPCEGRPKTCTLKRDGDQWFATIVCEIDVADPISRVEPIVAIDRGVVNTVADSDGNIVRSPRFLENSLRQLSRMQRAVARKQKGSKNQEKYKIRVMRIYRSVRRRREHFLHVLSHDYAKSHGVIIVEDLNIRNMVHGVSGGRNSNQKSGLNRGILDAGWGKFANMLDYKLRWSGGALVKEESSYSSVTCSSCQNIDKRSRSHQSFICTSCGYQDHADVNAARILKQRYEHRANRSVLLGEELVPEAGRRTKKKITNHFTVI
jgi:putative transposase